MADYAVLFSLITSKSTLHAATCRRVRAAETAGYHAISWVQAGTAGEAARLYSERIREQQLPEPKICKCAT